MAPMTGEIPWGCRRGSIGDTAMPTVIKVAKGGRKCDPVDPDRRGMGRENRGDVPM